MRFSSFIVKLEKHCKDSQSGYKGHVLVSPQDPAPFLPSLPRAPQALADMVQVILVSGPREDPTEISSFKRVLSVIRAKISAWLYFRKRHNLLYHNVNLDQATLDA